MSENTFGAVGARTGHSGASVNRGVNEESPPPIIVDRFHRNSDVDSRQEAQHHTLGTNRNQASPGDHNHDGGTSSQRILPLRGTTLTGAKSGNTALESVIAALVKLGATDSTS